MKSREHSDEKPFLVYISDNYLRYTLVSKNNLLITKVFYFHFSNIMLIKVSKHFREVSEF